MKKTIRIILAMFVAPIIIFACSNKVSSQQSDTAEAVNQAKLEK